MFARDDTTNTNLHFSDKELAESQLSNKHQNNLSNSISKDMTEKYNPGDFIAVNNEKNKHNIRDVYYVDQVFNDKLQVNKILRFHSANSKLQTKHRIVHKNDVFVVKSNKINEYKQEKITSVKERNSLSPNHQNVKKWCAFPDYNSLVDISDDESDHEDKNKDPYESLKQWEIQQRQNARRTLSYEICYPNQQQPNQVDLSIPSQESVSSQDDWDHQFDTNSPQYVEDEPLNDEVFFDQMDIDNTVSPMRRVQSVEHMDIDSTLSPMSRVQSLDHLYDQNNLNIDTNACQNLEHLLPRSQKRKRISPPRMLLPMEREHHGVMTRRQVRLTCSDPNITTPTPKDKEKRRKRNAQ
jgi:hypothetical protein